MKPFILFFAGRKNITRKQRRVKARKMKQQIQQEEVQHTADIHYRNNDDHDDDDNDDDGDDDDGEPPDPPEPEDLRPGECNYCLQAPCVTSLPNDFLGNGQPACDENSGVRHAIYTRYWKVIANLGGWNDERYLNRKRNIGGGEWAVCHRREIMPICVLKQVRELYPNPQGIPYMGHKWE